MRHSSRTIWGLLFLLFPLVVLADTSLRIATVGPHVLLSWNSVTGQTFQVERRDSLSLGLGNPWALLATNLQAAAGLQTTYTHSNALVQPAGFYRLLRLGVQPPLFTFSWDGTNFSYTDTQRTFNGVMVKPAGAGPFGGLVISHGAGSSPNGYSLAKAREMSPWGMVCIAPTLTHASSGETNPVNMGSCAENIARITACAKVLASLSCVDTNRIALFGHSMGAFATIGAAGGAQLSNRLAVAAITAGGVLADATPGGASNATPTVSEANPIRAPFLIQHCDADPIVPPARSLLLQQVLNSNAVPNQRILFSSNSIPNQTNWHNIHNDPNINALVLTNIRSWFQAHGVLP